MVIWIIGLSGSGKTYLAKKILKALGNYKKVHVDGDEVRKYLTYNLGYSYEDRKKNSIFMSDLCKFLEEQNFIVVCSTLSNYPDHQRKNRKKYKKYFQIYIKSELNNLSERNKKNIYSKRNVVGKDIKFIKPVRNDFIIKNNFKPFQKIIIDKIISKIKNANKTKKNNRKN